MKLRFLEKKQETGDVWSFYFKPLEQVSWQAGQSIRLEILRPTYGYDERRFTIASAPHEAHIQITTRLSGSAFKQLLDALELNQEIEAHNIEGIFTWGKPSPTLCIAGGVGITPFRALILDAEQNNALDDVILLHRGNETPAIFESEFAHIATTNTGFSYHQLAQRLDLSLLNKLAPDWKSRQIYIAGTPSMIKSLMSMFVENGAKKQQILIDIFTGNLS